MAFTGIHPSPDVSGLHRSFRVPQRACLFKRVSRRNMNLRGDRFGVTTDASESWVDVVVAPFALSKSLESTIHRFKSEHRVATRAFDPISIGPPALAVAAGMCFDQGCQESMDRIFLLVITLPLLALAAAIVWAYRPFPEGDKEQKAFQDPETGVVFEAEPGVLPERDRKGELAYRAVSYTPWPVEAGAPGDRLRINVGPVGQRSPRTFVFQRTLKQPSEIIAVTLPRPFGIVFEEDKRNQRVVVESLLEGSVAYRLARKAKLDGAAWAVKTGDVLRACTCTNFVYQGVQSMVGLAAPQRSIVLYGTDNQRWPQVMDALRKGDKGDGEVTLVLERQVERSQQLVTDEQAKFDY